MAAEDASNQRPWVYAGTLLVAVVVFIGLGRNHLRLRWNAWRRERSKSEKAYFQHFVKAARSGKPADTLNALMHWLDRIDTRDQAARLDQFLDAYSDPQMVKEADRLIKAIDPKTQTHWHGSDLIKGMTKARRKWLAQQRRSTTANQRLPQLNPNFSRSKI